MVEKEIKDHSAHLRQLTAKAMTNKAEAIKELIDYLILAHQSSYVMIILSPCLSFYSSLHILTVGWICFRHSELILERGIELI